MLRSIVVLVCLILPVVARGAEPESPPPHRARSDLAIQARAILKRYCAGCHTGEKAPGKSTLDVLTHAQLTAPGTPVPFVSAQRSQILELIKDGSMPPANRLGPTSDEIKVLEEWAKAGAPEYPKTFDDEYAAQLMLEDLKTQTATAPNDASHFRYISFAHRLDGAAPLTALAGPEAELRAALRAASGKEPKLDPLDAAATVFRLDLRSVGWHTPDLFGKLDKLKPAGVAGLIPFDLVLMEYPFGFPAPGAEKGDRPRPAPVVHADWLTTALVSGGPTPLAADLRSLVELAEKKEPAPAGPPLRPFTGRPFKPTGAQPAPRPVVAPLSSWYHTDVSCEPPFSLTAELVSDGKPVVAVGVGQPFHMRVSCDRKVNVLLLFVAEDGEVRLQEIDGVDQLTANKPADLGPPGGFKLPGIVTGCPEATVYLVLFASEQPIPTPTVVRSKHGAPLDFPPGDEPSENRQPVWRFVFAQQNGKAAFDPNRVVRLVVPVKVAVVPKESK